MPDHKEVYTREALNYERLVSREDYRGNLLVAIRKICDPACKDVVELGAGTGRLTCLLAPLVRSITAFDISPHMLAVAESKLNASGLRNWRLEVSDHRSLTLPDGCADLALSGWSICYLADWGGEDWRTEVRKALAEMERTLRPGGTLLIIETQGTGFKTPTPPPHLAEYFRLLTDNGFQYRWIRTDYRFSSLGEGEELAAFFFGEEMKEKLETGKDILLPECTGLWWKVLKGSA